MKFAVF